MAKKSPSKSFPKVELENELWQQLKHKIYLTSGPQITFKAHQCVALEKYISQLKVRHKDRNLCLKDEVGRL